MKVISKMPLPSLQAGAKAVTTSSTWAHSKASCPPPSAECWGVDASFAS